MHLIRTARQRAVDVFYSPREYCDHCRHFYTVRYVKPTIAERISVYVKDRWETFKSRNLRFLWFFELYNLRPVFGYLFTVSWCCDGPRIKTSAWEFNVQVCSKIPNKYGSHLVFSRKWGRTAKTFTVVPLNKPPIDNSL